MGKILFLLFGCLISVCRSQDDFTINLDNVPDITVLEGRTAEFRCPYTLTDSNKNEVVIDDIPKIFWEVNLNNVYTHFATIDLADGSNSEIMTNVTNIDFKLNGDSLTAVADVKHNDMYQNMRCGVIFVASRRTKTLVYTVVAFPNEGDQSFTLSLMDGESGFAESDTPVNVATCKSGYGYPPPVISFKKNGKLIEVGNTTFGSFLDSSTQEKNEVTSKVQTMRDLFINVEAEDDKAEFVCVVSTSHGSLTKTYEVPAPTYRVKHPTNKVTLKADQENAFLGSTVTLKCEANGFPDPTYEIADEYTNTASIEITKEINGNTYTCTARNSLNDDGQSFSDTYSLNVLYIDPPTVSEFTQPSVDEEFTVTCSSSGNPAPSVSWYNQEGAQVSTTGTLAFSLAVLEDSGEYVCKAENGYDDLAIQTTQSIQVKGMSMDGSGTTENVLGDADDIVEIECQVKSNPEAIITWTDTSENVEMGMPIVKKDGYTRTSTLKVGPLSSEFSGIKYTCTAVSGGTTLTKEFVIADISAGGSSVAGIIIGILVAILLVAIILAVLYNKGVICKKGEKGDETANDITPVPNEGNQEADVEAGNDKVNGTNEEKEKLMSDQQQVEAEHE